MDNRICMNVDVFPENKNKKLCVRFDIISNGRDISNILELSNLEKVATQFANESPSFDDLPTVPSDFDIFSKRIIKNLLRISSKQSSINSFQCELGKKTYQVDNKIFNHVIITYQLPIIPCALINWIAYLSIFMNLRREVTHVQLGDYTQFASINNINMKQINQLFSLDNVKGSSVRSIMGKIIAQDISSNELRVYENALIDFKKIYNYYVSCGKTLIQCISDQTRFSMLYDNDTQKLFSFNNSEIEANSILDTVLSPITDSAKIEFLFMLELLGSKRKIKLVSPCIGKIADDNLLYTIRHTELMLIYFGKFQLCEDEKIAMVDLENNPAYIEWYQKGKRNHDILDRELKHLAKYLGWEFDPDVNFHRDKKIVFSKEYSSKLIKSGLFINADLYRDLVNVYKFWTFFTKLKLENDNLFSKLPDEVLNRILLSTIPAHQQFEHPKISPTFFKAVNRGKERGKQLHAEIVNRKQRQTYRNEINKLLEEAGWMSRLPKTPMKM